MHNNSIVVFDLDGTIIQGNSFHKYITFLTFDGRSGLSLRSRFAVLYHSVLRLAKLKSHKNMKACIVRISKDIEKERINLFVKNYIMTNVNKYCIQQLNLWKEKNIPVVLATAAPLQYSKYISEYLSFITVLASEINKDGCLTECLREEKARRVLEYADGREILAVYSDHKDDLPLFELSTKCFLVNPESKNEKIVLESCKHKDIEVVHRI